MSPRRDAVPADAIYPNPLTRKSVSLTLRDQADLDLVRRSPEALRAVGAHPEMSEAALLHVLLEAGLRLAREAADEAGYAALAQSYQEDPEERAIRGALRHRRRAAEIPSQ